MERSWFIAVWLLTAQPVSWLSAQTCRIEQLGADGEMRIAHPYARATLQVEIRSSLRQKNGRPLQAVVSDGSPGVMRLPHLPNGYYRVLAVDHSTATDGMRVVPRGYYVRGNQQAAQAGEDWFGSETPAAAVYVSTFHIDRHEITNQRMCDVLQWALDTGRIVCDGVRVLNAEGTARELVDIDDDECGLTYAAGRFAVKPGLAAHPCVEVSWYGAVAFCNYRSDLEGFERCVSFADWNCDFARNGYRLPSEAEWEKAARGGFTGHMFPWASAGGAAEDHVTPAHANYENSGDPYEGGPIPHTTPAGIYPDGVNNYGLHDMAGNAMEWCWDWYAPDWYAESDSRRPDPTGPVSGTTRVQRGGSWRSAVPAYALRNAQRTGHYTPDITHDNFGFRCVRRP